MARGDPLRPPRSLVVPDSTTSLRRPELAAALSRVCPACYLARHVANAREQELGVSARETLTDIRLAFEDTWSWDVGTVEGAVADDGQQK